MLKKALSILLLSITLFTTLLMPISAAYDTGAAGVGYKVNLDDYEKVVWRDRTTINVYHDGQVVGTSCVDIGYTRAKSTVGDYYIDAILTRTSMKGKGSNRKYGYSDSLQLSYALNSEQILWAHAPKATADSTSYTIGLNVGGAIDASGKPSANAGISASHTFTKNALDVYDLSDPSSNLFRVKFDYNHATWRWDWKTLNTYAYNYTEQLASYEIMTTSSKYTGKLIQEVKFKIYDQEPCFWANIYQLSLWDLITGNESNCAQRKKSITITTAY